MTSLIEMMKRAIRETTNRNATDLNAVAPLTMEAKKAWIASLIREIM
jgi:hypothetical protein